MAEDGHMLHNISAASSYWTKGNLVGLTVPIRSLFLEHCHGQTHKLNYNNHYPHKMNKGCLRTSVRNSIRASKPLSKSRSCNLGCWSGSWCPRDCCGSSSGNSLITSYGSENSTWCKFSNHEHTMHKAVDKKLWWIIYIYPMSCKKPINYGS